MALAEKFRCSFPALIDRTVRSEKRTNPKSRIEMSP
jgi:hypothetical protein